jgi:hypothetical protein
MRHPSGGNSRDLFEIDSWTLLDARARLCVILGAVGRRMKILAGGITAGDRLSCIALAHWTAISPPLAVILNGTTPLAP